MKTMGSFFSFLSFFPIVFYCHLSSAQVSKPKEPRRGEKVKQQNENALEIETISELKQVMAQMKSDATVGDLFDLLKSGFATPYREALLKHFSSSGPDWRNASLPKIDFAENSIAISVKEGSKVRSIKADYVLNEDVFAKLNGETITVEQASHPEKLIERVEEIVEGKKKTATKVSHWLNLLIPQAQASFSFNLNISGIFQMFFMYKMMKMMMKSFNQPQYSQPCCYGPPQYRPPHPHYYHYYQRQGSY